MNYSVLLVAMAALVSCNARAMGDAGGQGVRSSQEVVVGNVTRYYNLYVPALKGDEQVPLMVVLHGGLGNAEMIEEATGLNDIADEGRFIIAYPEGTGIVFASAGRRKTWNAGSCCGPAVEKKVDDVGFVAAMIAQIADSYSIDLRRIYLSGMSNGGMMAYRFACEMPEKVAAIVVVSATLAVDDCKMAKDIPVLHIHGDADENVPFDGGAGKSSVARTVHRSVPETIRLLREARGCAEGTTLDRGNGVEEMLYSCPGAAPIRLLVIKGGEHSWPGGRPRKGEIAGSSGISASREAWEFAKQFSKPD